jgi:hypothetical protein
MKKASTLKVAAQLRNLTSYVPVKENDTRWSSSFRMVDRFLKIQAELSGVVDLLSLLPNHLEVDFLARSFIFMKKFDSITVVLQREGMTFVESREIFDLFLKDFPDFEHHLGNDANIVTDSVFEKSVVQIARGLPLTDEQKQAATVLLRPEEPMPGDDDLLVSMEQSTQDDEEKLYAQAIQQKLTRQRREATNWQSPHLYINFDILPGTSVDCERLFSSAKFILSDTRKRTSPQLFEAILLLKVNSSLWNAFSVGQAMGMTSNSNSDCDEDSD